LVGGGGGYGDCNPQISWFVGVGLWGTVVPMINFLLRNDEIFYRRLRCKSESFATNFMC